MNNKIIELAKKQYANSRFFQTWEHFENSYRQESSNIESFINCLERAEKDIENIIK